MTYASAPESDDLLLFTPVVSAYRGANGWSTEVQRAFVAALARTGVVAAAARSVGRSARSAYQLRIRAGKGSGFARAWDEARRRGCDRALDHALAASFGERRSEVWYRGRHVGWRTTWNDGLVCAALRALARNGPILSPTAAYATSLLGGAT